LNAIDSLQNQGEYIEELRSTFERIEDSDVREEEIEYIEIEATDIKMAKGGEI